MIINVNNDEMLGRTVEKELYFELYNRLKEKDAEIDQLKAREEEHQRLNGELREENERLNKRNKEIYEGFITTTQELCETTKELEKANSRIKMALDYIKNAKGNNTNYIATLLLGYPVEIEEKRKQVLDILGSDKE